MSRPRSRTPLILAIVLAVVAVAAIAAFAVTRGEDGNDSAECPVTPPPTEDGNDSASGQIFRNVSVEGDWLVEGVSPDDPCVGVKVPTVEGEDYADNPTAIAPGQDGPMMIVVMAHWCPHCNREVPLLVEWGQSGDVPQNLHVVGVSTAAREGTDHFPPGTWLADEMGWTWPVIADDEAQTAALALGTPAYPYLMFVDADGNLMGRVTGERPIEEIQQFADATAATAT